MLLVRHETRLVESETGYMWKARLNTRNETRLVSSYSSGAFKRYVDLMKLMK